MNNTITTPDQREQFERDGYILVRGLIPPDVVQQTRDDLLCAGNMTLTDEATWKTRQESSDWAWGMGHLTTACRSREVEQVVEELVGPHFQRGVAFHWGKDRVGLEAREDGFIPVLSFPHAQRAQMEPKFVEPQGWHLDGIYGADILPTVLMMVIFVYLTDVSTHGGATSVKPGSHRQVFEHWAQHGDAPISEMQFAPSLPIEGKAGDVIFFHYLLVHSGSDNLDDHIRLGLNTCVHQDPAHPYQLKEGAPDKSWTPFDKTLRVDNVNWKPQSMRSLGEVR